MKRVYDFLKECDTYYLATVEGLQPRVRPFGTIDMFEGKLFIQTGKSKDVSKQIALNPRVEISGMADGKWIRVAATLVEENRVEAKQHMLDEYPMLKDRYSATDDNTQLLLLKDATATIYSFNEEPIVIKF